MNLKALKTIKKTSGKINLEEIKKLTFEFYKDLDIKIEYILGPSLLPENVTINGCDLSDEEKELYEESAKNGIITEEQKNAYFNLISIAHFFTDPIEENGINKVYIVENPNIILMNDANQLHNWNGPAIEYLDGSKYYFSNGILMNEDQIVSDKSSWDMEKILTITNVEQRQEVIKIIGFKNICKISQISVIERLTGEELYNKYPVGKYGQAGDCLGVPVNVNKDGSVVLENGQPVQKKIEILGVGLDKCDIKTQIRIRNGVFYELLDVNIGGMFRNGNTRSVKVLRMGNPSLEGEEHFEEVDNSCSNVFQAILNRNQQIKEFNYKKEKGCLPYQLS